MPLGRWRERVCEPGPSLEAQVIWSEAMNLLREELEQLPARNVAVLTLLADKEKDYQQISSLLSTPVGSIGPTRARSLSRLRVALRSRGFDRDLPSVP
jgi:DNA-directed RNA polymerase specialized sigma24 family protein